MYIRNLIKHHKHHDREAHITNREIITESTYLPPSLEVYLLQKCTFLLTIEMTKAL